MTLRRAFVTLTSTALLAGAAITATPANAITTPANNSIKNTAVAKPAPNNLANQYLGKPRSGNKWHSGAWVGGFMSGERATRWGAWRGAPSDVTPSFPGWDTWKDLNDPSWEINTFKDFKGVLLWGQPILPREAKPSDLKNVAAGKYDETYRRTGRELQKAGRGNSVVRIGWEGNGTWMPWSVTASTAGEYKTAYRRIHDLMKKEAPGLKFSFDINCGTVMRGQKNRLDSLNLMYPGDDVVDMVGCSHYDWGPLRARNENEWRRSIAPDSSVGLSDLARFAREHKKGLSVSEWGLASPGRDGNGDNPYFIRKMREFFQGNSDVLVLESYFAEAGTDMKNHIWDADPLNPKSGEVYRKLW
ncbi:Endoglucanase H precursor [Dermatophilus congolensis]|uniref:Endoglucanase H n=1 Tax=Dermatophilus congolensis TaxID=1863 RepID=A0AA46BPA0_9MICO|nr:glycosyl hydrolase [Dermatophilus congolensis]STD12480.1 Endoglucanase H precursor [Dermatophilus congolensis]